MEVKTVGIVGLGLLGRGIAACLLSNGFRVVAYTLTDADRLKAKAHIADAIVQLIQRGGLSPAVGEQWPGNYVEARGIADFRDCDFVIESVTENMQIKQSVFDEIESVVSGTTPIGSNTSALPITLLQQSRKVPARFVGMHWAEPCHLTRFLEVIRGEQTDDATADAAMNLGRAAGKEPCLVQKDVAGFIVNRIGYAMYREAFWLLENGVADAETIDRAFHNAMSVWCNIMGPFRWMDLTGLPAYASVMETLWPQLSRATQVPQAMRDLVQSGAKGVDNLRGFYQYTPDEVRQWQARIVENVWRGRTG